MAVAIGGDWGEVVNLYDDFSLIYQSDHYITNRLNFKIAILGHRFSNFID